MTDPSTVPGSAAPEAADLGELARLGTGRHSPFSETAVDDPSQDGGPERPSDALPQQQGRAGTRRSSAEVPVADAAPGDRAQDAHGPADPDDDTPAPTEPAGEGPTPTDTTDGSPPPTETTDDGGSVTRPEPAATTLSTVPDASTDVTTTAAPTTPAGHRHRRRRVHTAVTLLLALALLATAGVGFHLYRTSQAWEDRSATYLAESRQLGQEVAATRAELDGTQAELDAVRAQLTTAQDRIRSLADEKAQLRDDSEIQRQVVDYQERVTDAAGRVALALDECVQGQNQLIGYMENAAAYDPAELEQYGLDVQALCQAATEANTALQRELAR